MEETQTKQMKYNNFILPEVSFFCPAYHDEGNLPKLIPVVFNFISKISRKFEIIIIEDGSPDKTGEIADNLAKQYPYIRTIHHPQNLGYGATIREGFFNARYEYVMYTDGDNQYDVREFGPYLYLLKTHDILSGYAKSKIITTRRKIQSFVYNLIIKFLFFVNIRDIDCAMKIYSRKALDAITIKSSSAFIDAEMLIQASRKGFKIAQFPVTQYPRTSGSECGSKFGVVWATIKEILLFKLGLL